MWYLSLAAEALLLWTLGARSAWGRYLAFDLVRAAVLLSLGSHSVLYTRAWICTEPVSLGFQFLAIEDMIKANVRSDNRLPLWLFGLASLLTFGPAFLLAPGSGWAFSYQWMILARHIAVGVALFAVVLSALLSAFAGLRWHPWLLVYYWLQALNLLLMRWLGPDMIRPLNSAHAAVVGVFFLTWAICTLRAGIPGTARPR